MNYPDIDQFCTCDENGNYAGPDDLYGRPIADFCEMLEREKRYREQYIFGSVTRYAPETVPPGFEPCLIHDYHNEETDAWNLVWDLGDRYLVLIAACFGEPEDPYTVSLHQTRQLDIETRVPVREDDRTGRTKMVAGGKSLAHHRLEVPHDRLRSWLDGFRISPYETLTLMAL